MKKQTVEKVVDLYNLIKRYKEILETIETERTHWWSLITPNLKRNHEDGLYFPDKLREDFRKLITDSITDLEKEIEKL